jgi:hypothetical protein
MTTIKLSASIGALLVTLAVPSHALAAAYCKLSDGTMGQTCVVASSGQVYGCVKDLKDCGALSTVPPPSGSGSRPAPPPKSPSDPAPPKP